MLLLCSLLLLAPTPTPFHPLAPGVEEGSFVLEAAPAAGDGLLHVVRIDPRVATLELALASEHGGERHTAGAWAESERFKAVINAGMFDTDGITNVGRLQHAAHANQPHWKAAFKSVLLLGPREKGLPSAELVDRDAPGFDARAAKYASLVQNLRLIQAPGVNVWKPNGRKWSEALVAQDNAGRILFCFARTPLEMAELNDRLLALKLGIVRAMHVEGGPEASLSVRAPGKSEDLMGSYETGFMPADTNQKQWDLPNVLGVR